MLTKFLKKVKHLYITSYGRQNRPKKRERSMEKAIQKFNPTLKEVQYQKGIVENYIDLDGVDKKWAIRLYDKAFEIDPEFVNGL